MGPVDWLAVVLAAAAASGVGMVRHGPWFRPGRPILPGGLRPAGFSILMVLVFLLAAAMLGHSFARIGAETLDARPWLYFMQSGGIALAFVIPAILLTHTRQNAQGIQRLADALFWLIAYLAMGLVFWLLG